MPLIIASVSEYANEYIDDWAKENDMGEEEALDAIVSSVRRETEGSE